MLPSCTGKLPNLFLEYLLQKIVQAEKEVDIHTYTHMHAYIYAYTRTVYTQKHTSLRAQSITHPFIYISIGLSVYLSIYLTTYVFVYLSIYPSVYLSGSQSGCHGVLVCRG